MLLCLPFVQAHFAAAKQLEEEGEHCTTQQACTFLEALFSSLCGTDNPAAAENQQMQAAATQAQLSIPVADSMKDLNVVTASDAHTGTIHQHGATGSSSDESNSSTASSSAVATVSVEVIPSSGVTDGKGDIVTGVPFDTAPDQHQQHGVCTLPGGGNLSPPPSFRLPQPPQPLPSHALVATQDAEHQTAVQQLQFRLNQLAPLYLSEPAVDVVRAAPALASEASQRYARALLERELAVLALVDVMLEDEQEAARQQQKEAADRLQAHQQELSNADAEHARVSAEGPASHRKRDMLDKATKEAEHREKLADLTAKNTAAREAISVDEADAAAAAAAASDAANDLARVREQARQIAARKKNLEDLNAQLAAPVPAGAAGTPITAVAATAAAAVMLPPQPAMVMPPPTAATSTAATANTATATTRHGGAADPAAISIAAELGWSWRAQRLECLMYRVLWVAEAVKLFQQQYSPHVGGRQYELLVRASKWARSKCDEYDATLRASCEGLAQIRSKLQELAW